ncbi:phosphatidylglycerophosphatase A [Streptococcus pneumoniae]|nr:phosphatidylglycerophosphatase A [Streptococcus pneumoniae]
MKYDLYDNCIELLKEREVTIEDMAALVIFSQQKYYPELTLDDASYAIQRVLKKREVQNVIMTGIELDKLAEAQKLSPEFQKIMEKDNPLYGIDEVIVLSILNLYGSIAFTNYGYLDKLKPLILERLNENHEGVCNVFLDDIVGAIAAAACSKFAHNHASDEI